MRVAGTKSADTDYVAGDVVAEAVGRCIL